LPSGIVETRSYDARRRLVEQTVAAEDRVVIRRRYGYNPLGRVVELDDSRRGRQRFSLDAMGRLTEAAGDRGVRRFSWGKSGERTGDLRYAAPFRASEDGGHAYHYDERGYVVRRVSATRTQELSWTPRGLLSEAFLSDGRTVQFAYDPHDRLIGRTVGEEARRYVWDNESLWGIRGNGGPRIGFVWVPGMRAPIEQSIDGRVFSIHADHIGTVRELVDEHGGIAWLNPAGLWGERSESDEISPVDCPLGFPGQIRDEITGLYYNRHRFYDGEIGRYLTPDPVGIFGGLDPYAYAPDPVNFYDPTGLACRGKNDDPTLLRGDSRPPDQICNQGFQPSNPAANISVLTHVNGVPTTGSNWISTTYESSTAERFANSAAAQYGGSPLVYVIDNPGCGVEVDCDPDVLAWEAQYGPAGSEQEIAFNGGVPASRILGYYPAGDPSAFQACP
jgi:RHS repeat-associated protein